MVAQARAAPSKRGENSLSLQANRNVDVWWVTYQLGAVTIGEPNAEEVSGRWAHKSFGSTW